MICKQSQIFLLFTGRLNRYTASRVGLNFVDFSGTRGHFDVVFRVVSFLAVAGVLVSGLILGGGPVMAQNATGELLASTCAGCHGQDGNSEGPAIPSIAGISVPYFINTMEQYRNGQRNSTIMNRVALGYDANEVQAMAFFFSQQTFKPVKQKFDAARAKRGARFHKQYCEYCHRQGGAEAGREGILAGQWIPYLKATMTDMVTGKRRMPPTMKRWVDRLLRIEGDEAVEDLMHYYASNTRGAKKSLRSLFPQ